MHAAQQRDQEKAAGIVMQHLRRFRRNTSRLLLGVMLSAITVRAGEEIPVEQSSSVPIVDLYRAGVIRFSSPGPAAVASRIKCSPSGDIYAIYSSTKSLEMWSAPIRRISVASRSVTEYPLPTISGYAKLARLSFDLSADGTLYALLRAELQSGSTGKSDFVYLVVKYKGDGRLDSYFS